MGSLLAPLFRSISHRPGNSPHKAKLLQRFIPRALSETPLGGSQYIKTIEGDIKLKKYQVALDTLKGREVALPHHNYVPANLNAFDGNNFMHKTLIKQLFMQLTMVFDNILKKG